MNISHEEIKDYVIKILRHYGFNAQPEYNIEKCKHRIDCAGWCDDEKLCNHYSIGVEISKTSDLAKDIDSVLCSNFDLRFIVALKPYKITQMKDIQIVKPDLFEIRLRNILNIPDSYPLYFKNEITKNKIRKLALEILNSMGKNVREIETTQEFENLINEFFEIFKDSISIDEFESLKFDLEDALKKYYGETLELSKEKKSKKRVIFASDVPPPEITNDEWEKAIGDIEEFKKSLENAGFPHFVDKAANLLLEAYSSEELLIQEILDISHQGKPHIKRYIPSPLYSLLEGLGYVRESSRRGVYEKGKLFFTALTSKGIELAKSLALKMLKEHRDFIDDQIEIYGNFLSFMACFASIKEEEYGNRGIEIKRVYDMFHGSGTVYKIITKNLIEKENSYENALVDGIWMDVQKYVNTSNRVRIPLNLTLFLESAINLPAIKSKILEFWSNFENKHLSFVEPSYTSRGILYSYKFYPIPEICYYILQKTREGAVNEVPRDVLQELNAINAIYTIYSLYRVEWKRGSKNTQLLEDILEILGIDKEYLNDIVEEMYSKGITSKLMDKIPYIIVMDEDKFKEHLIEKLEYIENNLPI